MSDSCALKAGIRLDLASLRELYKSGQATPADVIGAVYDRIAGEPPDRVWISILPRDRAISKARKLERDPLASARPLYGVPFAVADNIDIAGLPTTAACPGYSYSPAHTARVVQNLVDAGAIPIGKTNMGQSAAGLAGFSLGTDTAAFRGVVSLKPTRGVLSTQGVVPACRTLDCVSIFAANAADAHTVWLAARGFDPDDPFSRAPRPGEDAAPWLAGTFQFGIPPSSEFEFSGDAATLYEQAIARLEAIGGRKVEIDCSLFRSAAELLHTGPWIAERYAALRSFLEERGGDINPEVRGIIEGARCYSAADAYDAEFRLRKLQRAAASQWEQMDVLVLPTTGMNTNLLDLAAVALPCGISLIGPAFSDEALLGLAERLEAGAQSIAAPVGCIALAVVGAHLSGQPLNWQLTDRGARLIKVCRTAPDYRLYALEGTMPPKPGLVRDRDFRGPGIEVEVWAVPEDCFGSFVADLSAPLGIGSAVLDDGESVKCFICEPYALATSQDITRFGGWRHYLSQPVSAR